LTGRVGGGLQASAPLTGGLKPSGYLAEYSPDAAANRANEIAHGAFGLLLE
jgi:hypothetical protein